jgi:hypothetical protein
MHDLMFVAVVVSAWVTSHLVTCFCPSSLLRSLGRPGTPRHPFATTHFRERC